MGFRQDWEAAQAMVNSGVPEAVSAGNNAIQQWNKQAATPGARIQDIDSMDRAQQRAANPNKGGKDPWKKYRNYLADSSSDNGGTKSYGNDETSNDNAPEWNQPGTGFGTGNFAGVTNEDLNRNDNLNAALNDVLNTQTDPELRQMDVRDAWSPYWTNGEKPPAPVSSNVPDSVRFAQQRGENMASELERMQNRIYPSGGDNAPTYTPESDRSRPPAQIETPDWRKPGTGFGTGNFAGLTERPQSGQTLAETIFADEINQSKGRGNTGNRGQLTQREMNANEIANAYRANFTPNESGMYAFKDRQVNDRMNYEAPVRTGQPVYGSPRNVDQYTSVDLETAPRAAYQIETPARPSRPSPHSRTTSQATINTHTMAQNEPIDSAFSRWLREDMDRGMNLDQILLAAQQSDDYYEREFYNWIVNNLQGGINRTSVTGSSNAG